MKVKEIDIKIDLLGNDLFLITETQDELINRLCGYYSRMAFWEHCRKELKDPEKEKAYIEKIGQLGKLQMDLVDKSIDEKKAVIARISQQIKEADKFENINYKKDIESYNGSR